MFKNTKSQILPIHPPLLHTTINQNLQVQQKPNFSTREIPIEYSEIDLFLQFNRVNADESIALAAAGAVDLLLEQFLDFVIEVEAGYYKAKGVELSGVVRYHVGVFGFGG